VKQLIEIVLQRVEVIFKLFENFKSIVANNSLYLPLHSTPREHKLIPQLFETLATHNGGAI